MEAALDRDVERVSSLGALIITVATDVETRAISARPTDAVHDSIAAEFGRLVEHIEEALLGDDAVQPGESFEQWGIEVILLSRRAVACRLTLILAASRGRRTGRGSACASGTRRRSRTWWPT